MTGKRTKTEPFAFKQFAVRHHLCAHKIGFDGVLLGAWAQTQDAGQVLDMGTGSGLIALMTAQKNRYAAITAIELHEPSAQQAQQNFNTSPWANRLKLIHGDIFDLPFENHFDHIITNPPFFIDSLAAPVESRSGARHASAAFLEKLFTKTRGLLTNTGRFSFVFPYVHYDIIRALLGNHDLHIARLCNVYTTHAPQPGRILVECTPAPCAREEKDLLVYDKHPQHSAEYLKLTGDFYLHF